MPSLINSNVSAMDLLPGQEPELYHLLKTPCAPPPPRLSLPLTQRNHHPGFLKWVY